MTPDACAAELDRLGVPKSAGRPTARKALMAAGVACSTSTIEAAVQLRRVKSPKGSSGQVPSLVAAARKSLDTLVEDGRDDRGAWDGLAALVESLAQALENAEPRDVAGLSRELRTVLLELEAVTADKATGGVSDPVDDWRESLGRPVFTVMGDQAAS